MLNYTLDDLIKTAYELRASDIFIKAGARPVMRLHGKITPFEQALEPLKPSQSRDLCFSHMSHEQVAKFEHRLAIDLAFTVEGVCRIRANVYMQRQTVAGVFRLIPLQHWKLEELWSEEPEIARVLAGLTQYRQGLVLVTGPTGSGKSTTLAAMIDLINETRRGHIVTIEDPIEFVHQDKLCIVSQREVGIDTESFIDAMRSVVRESPDIILIGEMRDVETMHACMQAAETGHLVFSTVHTPSAYETMDRIVNMFRPKRRSTSCSGWRTPYEGLWRRSWCHARRTGTHRRCGDYDQHPHCREDDRRRAHRRDLPCHPRRGTLGHAHDEPVSVPLCAEAARHA
jgi:twitching motility protein PilT